MSLEDRSPFARVTLRRSADDTIVPKTEVAITRPVMQRADWLCECCKRDDGLRVVERRGRFAALCPACRVQDGMTLVIKCRETRERIGRTG